MKLNRLFALILSAVMSASAFATGSPEDIQGATTVDASAAKVEFDRGTAFIDTRNDSDWQAGRIADATHLDIKDNFSQDSLGVEVAKDDAVVFYCNGEKSMRSSKAAAEAVSWGYSKVYYFRDGFPAWKAAGYPVE